MVEVNVLLALKKQYGDLTGEDFVPAQPGKKPDAVGKGKQTETAKKVEQKKQKDCESVSAKMLESGAKHEKERQNEQGKGNADAGKESIGAREVKKVTRWRISYLCRLCFSAALIL